MTLLPRLWQRIFAYAFILVVASQALTFLILQVGYEKEHRVRMAGQLTADIAAALEGRDIDAAEAFLDFFKAAPGRLWLESPDGGVLTGEPPRELGYADAGAFVDSRLPGSAMEFMDTGLPETPMLARIPVTLKDGPAYVYFLHGRRPLPPMWFMFVHAMCLVCVVGGTLSFWIARRISRPLMRLRREVLEIAEGNLDKRVYEGKGEVAEVARSVNKLAGNLAHHIKGMQQLVANVSHELRSPLARMNFSTAIIEDGLLACLLTTEDGRPSRAGRASGLPLDSAGDPLALKHVRNLNLEIEHLEKLIGSSLLNSRLDLQQQKVELAPLDFSSLCLRQACRYEAILLDKGFVFEQAIAPGVRVEGDEALLAQILSNLLDNAGKYTLPAGTIRLVLRKNRGLACLSVENSHHGVSEDMLPHLFEPFHRGGLGTGSGDGVGLGLALVDKIAACHHGRARVENSALGLLFSVELPLLVSESAFEDWVFSRHICA